MSLLSITQHVLHFPTISFLISCTRCVVVLVTQNSNQSQPLCAPSSPLKPVEALHSNLSFSWGRTCVSIAGNAFFCILKYFLLLELSRKQTLTAFLKYQIGICSIDSNGKMFQFILQYINLQQIFSTVQLYHHAYHISSSSNIGKWRHSLVFNLASNILVIFSMFWFNST